MGNGKEKIIVLIPAFNEDKAIGSIIKELIENGLSVLVVDDGSSDNTAEVASASGARVIQCKENFGKGFAVREGIKCILEEKTFKWIVIMDADGQHLPSDVPSLMEKAEKEDSDIVVGDRMSDTKDMPFARYYTNRFTSWVVSRICGTRIPDTQCGFRVLKTDSLRKLKLQASNYDIESEILIQASKNNMKIKSASIKTVYGDEISKINPIVDTIRFFALVIRYRRDFLKIYKLKDSLILFFKGAAVGIANIIPGVSGGTIAVVLGIYDKLIESIAEFMQNPKKRKEYIVFLAKVCLGAVCAIFLLANVMSYLLESHFSMTMFLFMGFILGGMPAIVKAHDDMKIRTSRIMSFILGMILVLSISIIGRNLSPQEAVFTSGAVLTDTSSYIIFFAASFFAGGAMIVPGISGSFILVLLGQYSILVSSVKELRFQAILIAVFGAVLGIFIFSKVIDFLLKRMPTLTYYFIIGLICASFYKIFPGIPKTVFEGAICLLTFSVGTILSYFLSKL